MEECLRSLLPWGTQVILGVQAQTHGWPATLFGFITLLGSEQFYLILLSFMYWCVHRRVAVGLGYLLLLSAWLNNAIKYLFAIPRPSDPRIQILAHETSPSFPSGHAQDATTTWGYLAVQYRNWIFRVLVGLLILAISFSRIVLGVHFPQDIIGGWLIGLVLLGVYALAQPGVSRWIARQNMATQLGLVTAVPVLLIFLHPADTQGLYPAQDAITPMGALAGFGVAYVMERKWVRFQVSGVWWKRGLRFPLGLAFVLLFYYVPKLVLPASMAYGLEALSWFVQYALVGWAVGFLGPYLFVRLRLAEQEAG
jgi:membrane-associated phospholipid phosphatase